ncbi:methyltransferase domain-containing protein [candidate division KSB1 bacterium]|nr:methyltransferase domain-containing protein [candidate division KSB1 bacterium]
MPIEKPDNYLTVQPKLGKQIEWRMNATLKFLAGHTLKAPYLDVGTWSQATDILQQKYSDKIDSTNETDFNFSVTAPQKSYKSIFCFEVIEHLMNPLTFMHELHKLLDEDGILALSTPTRKLAVEKVHFTEYNKRSLDFLFKEAGFTTLDYKVGHAFPWWWHFTGVRPMYRMFFHHYHFYLLTKKEQPRN